ncbi:MAG: hypothetical protein ACN6RD_00720 [Stenotrophomonas maltophilia]
MSICIASPCRTSPVSATELPGLLPAVIFGVINRIQYTKSAAMAWTLANGRSFLSFVLRGQPFNVYKVKALCLCSDGFVMTVY